MILGDWGFSRFRITSRSRLHFSEKMFALRCKHRYPTLIRRYNTHVPLESSIIRSRFIDYFVNEKDHTFIRSSPLKPINDPTIPFVNAGMVQFKSVLQGHTLPPAYHVANSQKCARVGGKHNDLNTVGMDGYHHTFFEMLGNWSFGNCDKYEACKMAWELLTKQYGLDPKRLYVTYFGGDSEMELKPDLETREIWRQLSVDESHILPFGAKENFWEMGLVGPCGPCTEIHVDHIPQRQNAGQRVNAGFSDLTELWNLVFIEFNRNADGSLQSLKQSHVDTGMGFERLVALLNGVESNYDTDLFKPLMKAIHEVTGCPPYAHTFDQSEERFEMDRAYRILSDHSRLLTVALADGVVPHTEFKVRWVLRKALNVCSDVMKKDEKLLVELTNIVAESLYSAFPEIGKKLSKVKRVIEDEAEIYKALRKELPKAWVNLIKERPDVEGLQEFGSNRNAIAAAFKKMNSSKEPEVSPQLAVQFYDSHGMTVELISEMANLSGKTFNIAAYEKELSNFKTKSKLSTAFAQQGSALENILSSANIPETNSNLMYEYDPLDDGYRFPSVAAKVVGLLVNGQLQPQASSGEECAVILDRTNFYHTAGGQECDNGEIIVTSRKHHSLRVKEVTKVGDHIVHFGHLNGRIQVGDEVRTEINAADRIACMQNHTLAHLINGRMQTLFDAPLQEKCVVRPSFLKFTYYLHGEEFKSEDAKSLEDAVSHAIDSELNVDRYTVNLWQLPPGTTLLPDESYPVDNIHIIDIKRGSKIISREACCGTHVSNTKDIGKFCIVEIVKSKKTCVCAVTGSEAEEAIANSKKLLQNTNKFIQGVIKVEEMVSTLHETVQESQTVPAVKSHIDEIIKMHKVYNEIRSFIQENSRRCSYVAFDTAASALEEGLKKMQTVARYLSELEVLRKSHKHEIISHVMQTSQLLEKVPLNKYTRLVKKPIILFALVGTDLKVRCCVPRDFITEDFNAAVWMKEAVSHLVDGHTTVRELKREEQNLEAQTRSLTFKKGLPNHVLNERCWKTSEKAYNFARSNFKSHAEKQQNAK